MYRRRIGAVVIAVVAMGFATRTVGASAEADDGGDLMPFLARWGGGWGTPHLTISGGGSVSGSDGCNGIWTDVTRLEGDRLMTDRAWGQTLRACVNDPDVLRSIPSSLAVEDGELVLYDEDDVVIARLSRSVPPLRVSVLGEWRADGDGPWIRLHADGSVEGYDGCSWFAGTDGSAKGDVYRFPAELSYTEAACPPEAREWTRVPYEARVWDGVLEVFDAVGVHLTTLPRGR
jgi:heat shock protein HslJ